MLSGGMSETTERKVCKTETDTAYSFVVLTNKAMA